MRLVAVGLGPGDPGLVTVKAAEALSRAPLVFVPYSSTTGRSLAEAVVRRYSRGEVVALEFPMGRTGPEVLARNGKALCQALERHGEGVYAVLGDPALYSTFHELLPALPCRPQVEVVPGVVAATACAARAALPLAQGDSALAIVPAGRLGELLEALRGFEAVVVYKAKEAVKAAALLRSAGFETLYARRCYMEGEAIGEPQDGDYFSLLLALRSKSFKTEV